MSWYGESNDSVPVEKRGHCLSSKSMIGPMWANSSSVRMEELEVFKICNKIRVESSLDRSIHFGNAEGADSILGASGTTAVQLKVVLHRN